MTTADVESKKRKRKHKTKKSEDNDVLESHSNGAKTTEKPHKKAKNVPTPGLEVKEGTTELSAVESGNEDDQNEAILHRELQQLAMEARVAKMQHAEEFAKEGHIQVNGEALNATDLPSGISMPTMDNPKLFSELKLSSRTMEAIGSMGFETMTEIQQKTIPPLLRYKFRFTRLIYC